MKTEKYQVTGMTCSACVGLVEKSVGQLDGVKSVSVSLLTNSMTVTFDELKLTTTAIEKSVHDTGYAAHLQLPLNMNTEKGLYAVQEEQINLRNSLLVSIAFLIPLLYMSMAHMIGLPYPEMLGRFQFAFMNVFIQLWLTLPILFINRRFYINGYRSLTRLSPNMDSLVAIATGAAIIYGIWGLYRINKAITHMDYRTVYRFTHDMYFESAAMILTLITLGKYLEAASKNRTSGAIRKLIDLTPKSATVIRQKVEFEIPVHEVIIDDIVVVRPGQQVPVDGIVYTGSSSVDESALTGESIPVFKSKGDKVLSASINKSGSFTLRATKVGQDTTLAQIIRLVEEASSSKAPISKLADKISAIFVPFVIVVAIMSAAIWFYIGHNFQFSLSIAIAVLVISCPCALGLATPVAIMVGAGKGAEHGILIKTAEALQLGKEIDTVVLDKTGTITEGKPKVTNLIFYDDYNEQQLVKIAACLEQPSEHPLAEAIILEAKRRNITINQPENFESIPGRGVQARLEGKLFSAGNQQMMKDKNINCETFIPLLENLSKEGKTPLLVADEKEVIGLIAVADTLKESSKLAIEELQRKKINIIMLTGDNKFTAKAIQKQVGITSVISEVLPHEKAAEIVKLQQQGHIVAMVGDGINDAPALTRAHIGIAIGTGTDIAIDSADIVLMRSDLLDVVSTLELSKAVMKNIKQNLFWAFSYNIIGIPLAAGIFYPILEWKLNPMFAAGAMSISSVAVVLNALRLLRFNSHREKPTQADKAVQDEVQTLVVTRRKVSTTLSNAKPKFSFVHVEKKISIEGMTCGHCSARVEKALNTLDGVQATVNLSSNTATLLLNKPVANSLIIETIEKAGYRVTQIN